MRRAHVVAGSIAIALALLLRAFPPDQFPFYPSCPFHALTGMLCPGCGGTRALAALLAGRWGEALHLNGLIAIGLPLVAVRFSWAIIRPSELIPRRLIPWLFAIAAIFTIARNLLARL